MRGCLPGDAAEQLALIYWAVLCILLLPPNANTTHATQRKNKHMMDANVTTLAIFHCTIDTLAED